MTQFENTLHAHALQLLMNMGYQYVSFDELINLRGRDLQSVLLQGVLERQIRKINRSRYGAEFDDDCIPQATDHLKRLADEGYPEANRKAYEALTMGAICENVIRGDKKSYTVQYVDWDNPARNIFHVAEHFHTVIGCVDLILFVNGVPMVVFELKANPDALKGAIAQHRHFQSVTQLYIYAQLLVAITGSPGSDLQQCRYATSVSSDSWFCWAEPNVNARSLPRLVNRKSREHEQVERRPISEQDRIIYGLCRHERLLDIVQNYILFQNGVKCIAQYHQYRAVTNTLNRVSSGPVDQPRPGGIIWHAIGSGRSLTIVMLVRCLLKTKDIQDPKIILVSDNDIISDRFGEVLQACGVTSQSHSRLPELMNSLQGDVSNVIITTHQKLLALGILKRKNMDSRNTFVLIDDVHLFQSKASGIQIRKVFENSCFIGITAMPLSGHNLRADLDFRDYIAKYSIEESIEERGVVPLLYEKKEFSRASDTTNESEEQRIFRQARDISEHFTATWKKSGLKGILLTSSMDRARTYHEYFQQLGKVDSVVVSNPAHSRRRGLTREIHDGRRDEALSHSHNHDLTIVDWPNMTSSGNGRRAVLYLDGKFSGPQLYQAFAQISREQTYEGEAFVSIVDFGSNLGRLSDESGLLGSELAYIRSQIRTPDEEVKSLARRHDQLSSMFQDLMDRNMPKEFAAILWDKSQRNAFHMALRLFSRSMLIVASSDEYRNAYSDYDMSLFFDDLIFFEDLKHKMGFLFADNVHYPDNGGRLQQQLRPGTTLDSNNTENILDSILRLVDKAREFIKHYRSGDSDFLERFSRRLDETADMIAEIRGAPAQQAEEGVASGEDFQDVPPLIRGKQAVKDFFLAFKEVFKAKGLWRDSLEANIVELALKIDEIILFHHTVDWTRNKVLLNRIQNDIEDRLISTFKETGVNLDFEAVDVILDTILSTAIRLYP
jgi:type I restriction enzyme R subunit